MSDFGFWDDEPPRRSRQAPPRGRGRRGRQAPRGHRSAGSRQPPRGRRPPPRGRQRSRPRPRRRRSAAPAFAIVILVIILGGGGWLGFSYLNEYLNPPDYSGQGTGEVEVVIAKDETATDVAVTLEEAGVVQSSRAFVNEVKAQDASTRLTPGTYKLRKQMSAAAALKLLSSPASRVETRLTIKEGWRATQIFAAITDKTDISLDELKEAVRDRESLDLPSYAGNRYEGFLYPATYTIEPKTTARQLLKAMVDKYKATTSEMNLEARAQRVGLTPREALVVASIVQAEAGRHSDMPKIARVIYNRLKNNNDKLQMDSTVFYALNKYGISATHQDLQASSRYNTYMYRGLPPGAISSPGEDALEAALVPARGTWYYFVTTDPKRGITEFTDNEVEFERLVAKLRRNQGAG
ncbi:MAG: endolytic transglycosylase MltG [Streptosporangiales bacterium]|nr:endolytic transglycosylase MltG [Streptosporangiales bacterium]